MPFDIFWDTGKSIITVSKTELLGQNSSFKIQKISNCLSGSAFSFWRDAGQETPGLFGVIHGVNSFRSN